MEPKSTRLKRPCLKKEIFISAMLNIRNKKHIGPASSQQKTLRAIRNTEVFCKKISMET